MLSDEIEALRAHGKTDEEIAALINKAAGSQIAPSEVARNYASPAERHRSDK